VAHLARLLLTRADVCLVRACAAAKGGDAVVITLAQLHAQGLLPEETLVKRLSGYLAK
jgi:hypothetical protein